VPSQESTSLWNCPETSSIYGDTLAYLKGGHLGDVKFEEGILLFAVVELPGFQFTPVIKTTVTPPPPPSSAPLESENETRRSCTASPTVRDP
jgi:hypothetical protein